MVGRQVYFLPVKTFKIYSKSCWPQKLVSCCCGWGMGWLRSRVLVGGAVVMHLVGLAAPLIRRLEQSWWGLGGMDWIKAWLGTFGSLVLFSCQAVSDSVTPWTTAHQASLSLTISQSLPKFVSIELAMLYGSLLFTKYVEGDKKATQGHILALAVQRLTLHAPNAGGSDSVPSWVTRSLIPQLKNDPACQNEDRRPCSARTKTQHNQMSILFFKKRIGPKKWSTMGEMIHWWSDMLGQGEVNLQISENI